MIRLLAIIILLAIVFVGGLATGGIKLDPGNTCIKGSPQFVEWRDLKHIGSISFRWPVFEERCKFYYNDNSRSLVPNLTE